MTRSRRTAAETREELLDAAARLLVERGSEAAVSVDDVVDALGVTPPTLYRYFSDKQALFAAVHAQRMFDFQSALQAAADRATDPVDRLEARGRRYVRYAIENPDSYRAVFMVLGNLGSEVFAGNETAEDSAYDDLVADVRSCIAAGQFEHGDAELIARVIWASVHGLASMLIAMPMMVEPYEIDEIIDASVTAITRAFAARTDTDIGPG